MMTLPSWLKLFFYFLVLLFMLIVVINSIFGVVLYFFYPSTSLVWHSANPWIVVLVTLLMLGSFWYKWRQFKRNGQVVAQQHGAQRIPANSLIPEEKRVLALNNQVALLFEMQPAHLYVLYRESGMNVFSVGFEEQDSSIIFSWGALYAADDTALKGMLFTQYQSILDKQQLQFTCCEMVFSGALLVSQYGSRLIAQSTQRKALLSEHDPLGVVKLGLGGFIWLLGSLGVLCSRIVKFLMFYGYQYASDRVLVNQYDAHAIQRTLARVHIHPSSSRLYCVDIEAFAQACFVNPLHPCSALHVQVPYKARMHHLNRSETGEDISPLVRQLKRRRFSLVSFFFKISFPIHKDMLTPPKRVSYDFLKPAVLRDCPEEAEGWDGTDALAKDIRHTLVSADVLARVMQTATGCREVILAIFLLRQYGSRVPEEYSVSQAVIGALQQQDPRTHVHILDTALSRLGTIPSIISRQFMSQIAQIIQADQCIGLLDCLLFERLKAGLGFLEPDIPVSLTHHMSACAIIVDALLCISTSNEAQRLQIRARVLKPLYTMLLKDDVPPTKNRRVHLSKQLSAIAGLLKREKLLLLSLIEREIWRERHISQDELDSMLLLYWRFGLSTQGVAERLLKRKNFLLA